MRFELARMFLLTRPQQDAFERRGLHGKPLTREEWLRSVFLERIDFVHRKVARRYDPDAQQPKGGNRIVARIGRETVSKENDPDDHLREIERPQWRACLAIIDPVGHPDGQKIAIEANSAIGSGFGNFQSLVTAVNARTPPEPYAIELHSITDQTSFWEYIKSNKGNVTSITLEVAMPNMFGGESSYEEDMKRLKEREKARRVKETIENPDGLEPNTERMRAAVSYATRGGGKVRAKAKDVAPYDSTKDKKFLHVDVDAERKDVNQKTKAALEAFEADDSGETEILEPAKDE